MEPYQELVSSSEAAQLLNTTELRILMLLKQGQLIGEERDGVWYVTRASIASYVPSSAPPKGHTCTGCGAHPGGPKGE